MAFSDVISTAAITTEFSQNLYSPSVGCRAKQFSMESSQPNLTFGVMVRERDNDLILYNTKFAFSAI